MNYKILHNGIAVPEYVQEKRKKPIAFSFFAGCGGMDLGFIQAGFEVVGANEFDEAAALTYMVNLGSYPINIHYIEGEKDKERLNNACERYIFGKKNNILQGIKANPDWDTKYGIYNKAVGSCFSGSGWIKHHPEASSVRNFWFGNVRKLKGKDILDTLGLKQGDIDCVMGGPPCQGFSIAGKQLIADPRNNLVYEFGRLIVELQPKTFVMEEVPAIVNFFDPDGVPVLDKFCLILQEGGYGKWKMIKKAMMTQANCAAGIKGSRGNESIKRKPKPQTEKQKTEQISMFEKDIT